MRTKLLNKDIQFLLIVLKFDLLWASFIKKINFKLFLKLTQNPLRKEDQENKNIADGEKKMTNYY